jgi:hypothetical protein
VPDGRVLPEPFLDLTKTNPLGSEVQTGFVEQGLWAVFGGALGAMRAFRDRMTQDEILRPNAYVRSLGRAGS